MAKTRIFGYCNVIMYCWIEGRKTLTCQEAEMFANGCEKGLNKRLYRKTIINEEKIGYWTDCMYRSLSRVFCD